MKTDDPQAILVLHRQNSAVGYYREWVRARALKALGHEVTWWEEASYTENLKPEHYRGMPKDKWAEEWFKDHLSEFDLLITDRAARSAEHRLLSGFRHYSRGMRMIVDFDDDFMNVPEWNPSRRNYQPGKENYEAGLQHLALSEMTTVSTPVLAERFKKYAHHVMVVPNFIDPVDWVDLPSDPHRDEDPHLRILYGGAAGHYGDLDPIRAGIEAVVRNPPAPFRLVCFGAIPSWMHELSREFPETLISLPWSPFADYPQVVAWGKFDLALAPLAQHPFNEGKSNIKALEAGIQGIPLLCSNVGPYADIPDGCAVKVDNTPAQWSHALRELLKDRALRERLAQQSREWVMDEGTIDSGLEIVQNMVEEALNRPRIESREDTVLPV